MLSQSPRYVAKPSVRPSVRASSITPGGRTSLRRRLADAKASLAGRSLSRKKIRGECLQSDEGPLVTPRFSPSCSGLEFRPGCPPLRPRRSPDPGAPPSLSRDSRTPASAPRSLGRTGPRPLACRCEGDVPLCAPSPPLPSFLPFPYVSPKRHSHRCADREHLRADFS